MPLFRKHNILTVTSLYILEASKHAKKLLQMNNTIPETELSLKKTHAIHPYNTRQNYDIFVPNIPSKQRKNNINYNCSIIYNGLPNNVKALTDMKQFKYATKKFLLNTTLYTIQELYQQNTIN